MMASSFLKTPTGNFEVHFSSKGIAAFRFPGEAKKLSSRFPGGRLTPRQKKILKILSSQLKKYFSGAPYSFKNIPLDLSFCTPFQKKVLDACRRIPAGKTVSYGELAAKIRRARASRAVGSALGRNCVPILIPCHRVVRGNGGLGGFTAGLAWKKRLIDGEKTGARLRVGR